MSTNESSLQLARAVIDILARFDVQGVFIDPNNCMDGWAVLKVSDGDREMPEMLASMDSACTALQVEGGFQMSFGWSKDAPAGARQLPVPRWPTVAVKASEHTPLDGMVTDFATRAALLNRHFWEATS
jgi:hypothetical protein